jgi:hypothetical protein
MAKKIELTEALVPCGFGQHKAPEKFNEMCHACLLASVKKLVELINKDK